MQPLLMRDRLEPFRADMEAMLRCPDDVIGHACLLWRMIYGVMASARQDSAGLSVLRHEDLSMDPISAFGRLYARLDLPFGDASRRAITRASTGGDGTSAHSWSLSRGGISRTGFRRLDSRSNVNRWKRLLTPAEVARVRKLTDDVASLFYTPDDWD
jgi:hypothetical protein